MVVAQSNQWKSLRHLQFAALPKARLQLQRNKEGFQEAVPEEDGFGIDEI
jgi:hypothetical protein